MSWGIGKRGDHGGSLSMRNHALLRLCAVLAGISIGNGNLSIKSMLHTSERLYCAAWTSVAITDRRFVLGSEHS